MQTFLQGSSDLAAAVDEDIDGLLEPVDIMADALDSVGMTAEEFAAL